MNPSPFKKKQPTDLHIVVPADIACRPKLTLHAKVALAWFAEFPDGSNTNLAQLLGLTERGVESMLRRLCSLGHLQLMGKGKTRTYVVLNRAQPDKKCGESKQDSDCPEKCPDALAITALTAPVDIRAEYEQARKDAVESLLNGRLLSNYVYFLELPRRVPLDKTLSEQEATQLLAEIEADIIRFKVIHASARDFARLKPEDYLMVLKGILNAPKDAFTGQSTALAKGAEMTLVEVIRGVGTHSHLQQLADAVEQSVLELPPPVEDGEDED